MNPSNSNRKAQALRYWQDRARQWLSNCETDQAYSALLFAFASSHSGEHGTAVISLQQARSTLQSLGDSAHQFLLEAYAFRIHQGFRGEPHRGPFSLELRRKLDDLESMERYVVDRLRQSSRALEPEEIVNPHQRWIGEPDELESELYRLSSIVDSHALSREIDDIKHQCTVNNSSRLPLLRLYGTALGLLPRMLEEQARELLAEAVGMLTALPRPRTERGFRLCAGLFDRALFAMGCLGETEDLHLLLRYFGALMDLPKSPVEEEALGRACTAGIRALWQLGCVEEIEWCHCKVLEWLQNQDPSSSPSRFHLLLAVAEARLILGKEDLALPILDEARDHMLYRPSEDLEEDERARFRLITRYVEALRPARLHIATERIEEILEQIPTPTNTAATSLYYSLPALELIEAIATNRLNLNAPYPHVIDEKARLAANLCPPV